MLGLRRPVMDDRPCTHTSSGAGSSTAAFTSEGEQAASVCASGASLPSTPSGCPEFMSMMHVWIGRGNVPPEFSEADLNIGDDFPTILPEVDSTFNLSELLSPCESGGLLQLMRVARVLVRPYRGILMHPKFQEALERVVQCRLPSGMFL